jgi:dipeptidyl-peptidase 4
MTRLICASLLLATSVASFAQDRLPTMPRYDRYEKLRREIAGSVQRGDLRVTWEDSGRSFTFQREGKNYRYLLATRQIDEYVPEASTATAPGRAPERGRQFDTVFSPDNRLRAFHRDRNVWIARRDGSAGVQVTEGGSAADRTKYGIASWVYGEELGVREAMWFSPDSRKLAFYRFDEKEVQDYFLTLDLTKVQNRLDVEAYPKAGTPNPKVELWVYDLDSKTKTRIDVDFDSGGGPDLGHYVYSVRWSPKGDEILFNRTNRKQNTMELLAADPVTGRCRLVIRESHPQSWAANSPAIRFLEDKHRFVWTSERNGFRNLYLYDLSGRLHRPLTQHGFDVQSIERLVEEGGYLFYTARSGDNPYKMQLHRVGIDGRGDRRLTDPAWSHSATVAPDGRHFVATSETLDLPPITRLHEVGSGQVGSGKVIATLAESNIDRFRELGLRSAERFQFTAADGETVLYGTLHKPSDFDPSRTYPLIVGVYAGPESSGGAERFATPNPVTELGFLVASFDGRGTNGRGKAFRDAVYEKLGVVEIDDQAAGVRALAQRPYVDGSRVGIHGTSYGGYATVMALLRHPDVFHAGVASSSVTDWRNYDTIYTERYQGLPDEGENKAGYDAGSAMSYARNLKGRLLLFYGTADNNVHPSNTYQLARALQNAGKSFEMMAGADQGHVGLNQTRMWEFFVENLITGRGLQPLEQTFERLRRERKRARATESAKTDTASKGTER